MAIKGLRIPYYGKYAYDPETNEVTYSEGGRIGKAVGYNTAINRSDNSYLYGDDFIAETAPGKFQNGDLSLTTTNLSQSVSLAILGAKVINITYGAGKSKETLVFDDDLKAPYLGFGIIEWHQVNDVDYFKAILLPKVFFNVPNDAATTQGESIAWQTPEIAGQLMRSDATNEKGKHPWKYVAQFDTAEAAAEFLRFMLGVPDEADDNEEEVPTP